MNPGAVVPSGEELVERMAPGSVDVELRAHGEGDFIGRAAKLRDLGLAARLLPTELVAGEADDRESFAGKVPLQDLKPPVLRSVTAAARDVDGERDLAAQGTEKILPPIDGPDGNGEEVRIQNAALVFKVTWDLYT